MNPLLISRWQFGITTVYHFFMVPLTIGLSMVVAWYQTRWYRTGDERYLRLTKFFGKLFLINFAMGVATGIVQEFQFGMNWADYSRFVGDVFGAPLAMEALVAFFLESTFLGLWIFGWDRLPKRLHLATIWAAAIGTWASAYFIVAANSWMQHPVGVVMDAKTGRPRLTDIGAVLTNPTTLAAFPHIIAGALMTAAMFVGGISAWMLIKRRSALKVGTAEAISRGGVAAMSEGDAAAMHRSLRGAIWLTFAAGLIVAYTGDYQARLMFKQQPMKMAAAEALCDTKAGAGLSVIAIGSVNDTHASCNVRTFTIPKLLSLMANHKPDSTVQGVNELEAAAQAKYGAGKYRPNLMITYWTFRSMVGFGAIASFGAVAALWWTRKGKHPPAWKWLSTATLVLIVTPFLANAAGWIFTEMGRQPWVVAPNPTGLSDIRLLTADAVSPSVGTATVAVSLIGFTLLYAALAVVELRLLSKYVKAGPAGAMPSAPTDDETEGEPLAFAY